MSQERVITKRFWLSIALLIALVVSVLLVVTTGVLATWLDPEPEGAAGRIAQLIA